MRVSCMQEKAVVAGHCAWQVQWTVLQRGGAVEAQATLGRGKCTQGVDAGVCVCVLVLCLCMCVDKAYAGVGLWVPRGRVMGTHLEGTVLSNSTLHAEQRQQGEQQAPQPHACLLCP